MTAPAQPPIALLVASITPSTPPIVPSQFTVPEGMPRSVFEAKYARKNPDGTHQTWCERAVDVVAGNCSLHVSGAEDHDRLLALTQKAVNAWSGRHMQHGDLDQAAKEGEKFTNCTTALASFLNFWLLMKGSGVGRCYDSDICRVDLEHMPNARFVLSKNHPDYEQWIEALEDARHKYDSESEHVRWFTVEDSAEGWVKIIEVLETAAFQQKHRDKLFIFDLTPVRPCGSPVRGQQNRPASGPIPLILALCKIASLKGAGMKPWKQAMHMDHYLAECVALGGIRRSARIATKTWRDRDVFEFIDIKRGGHLYTANDSVTVDDEFWASAASPAPSHARRVLDAMLAAAYFDGTGEPGFLNLSNMAWNAEGVETITADSMLSGHLDVHPRTQDLLQDTLKYVNRKKFPFLVNPCGEIVLAAWGGYCVIGNVCLGNAENIDEAREAVRLMTRALMRVNLMKFLYSAEVLRTNRIGVGLTGIHEWLWRQYGASVRDVLENSAHVFRRDLERLQAEVLLEAEQYAKVLGVIVPHTMTMVAPTGTVSKVLACTEGAHAPAYDYYLRWVQYRKDSDALPDLQRRGYPVMDISHAYADTVVVGFPTTMALAVEMGDKIVLAGDMTIDEHYSWIRLLEKHWLGDRGNNVSYTMKYDPSKVGFEEYRQKVLENQGSVRTCSMMPQVDTSAYAYQPEEQIGKEEYLSLVARIDRMSNEGYDKSRLECEGGACPIEMDIQ